MGPDASFFDIAKILKNAGGAGAYYEGASVASSRAVADAIADGAPTAHGKQSAPQVNLLPFLEAQWQSIPKGDRIKFGEKDIFTKNYNTLLTALSKNRYFKTKNGGDVAN